MLWKPERHVQNLPRRMILVVGARIAAFGAVCTTIGSTLLAACSDFRKISDGDNGHGSGYGSGYGY